MSNIKTYKVKATFFNDAEVTLAVDHDILTPVLAAGINCFWSDSEERLLNEDGDVVRAVIRLFGACAIRHAMDQGWGFSNRSFEEGIFNTQSVLHEYGEGWPDAESLGISITDVDADSVSFDDVSLEAA